MTRTALVALGGCGGSGAISPTQPPAYRASAVGVQCGPDFDFGAFTTGAP